MQKQNGKVFEFAALSDYPLKDRIKIRTADVLFYLLIKIVGKTLCFDIEGEENLAKAASGKHLPIYAFWHDRIFAGTYFFRNRGIVAITSQSLDGEYIARFIQRLGYGTVRGSSTRGGVGALVEMIRLMRKGHPMAFTVDGPKGPRYEAKSGAILLAKKTGNPILPFVVECKSYRTVDSWDKLQIPKLFTKAKVFIAKPMFIAPNITADEVEIKRNELQKILDELVESGKQWKHRFDH